MKKIWSDYRKVPFIAKISLGFVLGIIVSLIFREQAAVLKPFETLLINLLTLVAIPVIFLTVVLAVNQMTTTQLGRIG